MELIQFTIPRNSVTRRACLEMDIDFWLAATIEDEGYCLDAPWIIPAGSHRSVDDALYAANTTRRGHPPAETN